MRKKVKNGNRYYPICCHLLQQKGRYKNKLTYRWYCPKCHIYMSTKIIKRSKKSNYGYSNTWISYTFKENVWVWIPPIDILEKH